MDVPILVHPWATVGEERMPKHNFMYSIGMPSETALAAGSLIFRGIFDKYPDLKICFAHGGGTLPYLLPRIDQAWEVWPHIRTTEQPPSYYAKKFYYDKLVYDPRNLQLILEKLGVDHIIMGTDYPFLLREAPPGNVVEMLENVLDEEKKIMLGENAIEFLGLNKATVLLKKWYRFTTKDISV
jgi:aminocarboxymuconate-semialdehyde decarboxylase